MYVRTTATDFEFSPDARTISWSIPTTAFADISHACASSTGSSVVLTAVRAGGRVADVNANERGEYRAYRVDATGIEQLTKEYTNTAIALPQGGIAYSNGSALVIARGDGVEKHKVGRFSWGPTAVSCNDSGSVIGMTKWKGDDRKLAWTKGIGSTLEISRFSYYSYLLVGDDVYYCLSKDIHAFNIDTKKSTALTTKKFKQQLLTTTGVRDSLSDVEMNFTGLGQLAGKLIVIVQVLSKGEYEELYHGVISIDRPTGTAQRLYKPEHPFRVTGLYSNGATAQLELERYENMRLAESKLVALGRDQHYLEQQWRMLAVPTQPELGFQFFPSSRAADGAS